MKSTGYGKGWQEPKAETIVGRAMQIMREPASKNAWVGISALYTVAAALIILFL